MSKILQYLRETKHKCPYKQILDIICLNKDNLYALAHIKYDLQLLKNDYYGQLLVTSARIAAEESGIPTDYSYTLAFFINFIEQTVTNKFYGAPCSYGYLFAYGNFISSVLGDRKTFVPIGDLVMEWSYSKIYYNCWYCSKTQVI